VIGVPRMRSEEKHQRKRTRSEGALFRLFAAVEDAIFPAVCGGCRKRGAWLCPECRASLRRVPGPICRRCGRSIEGGSGTCHFCRGWTTGLRSVRAAFVFEGALRSSIHRFKYHGEYARGQFLGELLADYAEQMMFQPNRRIDLVIPVPLHARRERERGFNQAEILAAGVAQRLGLPLAGRLTRAEATRPQATLGFAERWENVGGAFRWESEPLEGQNLLLIDDVTTTGATLAAAAAAVVAPAVDVRVHGLTLAREL
jgi:ComF family protein